ncbi:PadR family transcriptional regulator [uncultured Agrococcus sp.]|uniref:PadR family transcriptional regulator n=1 Tax=uncultured Agrococcus sp. TaxID=382258 RepID=UPI00260054D8|nr:PadR family transcriptional regulator [uncultured Agrococcus sp.]
MNAVFAHGDLRLYLLHLLSSGPKHGYEFIQLVSDRFGGTYSPSPGTVYPRLAKLEAEGLVSSERHGRTTRYELTEAGSEYVAAHAEEIAELERSVSESVHSLADQVRGNVREAMKTLRADLAAAKEREANEATFKAQRASGETDERAQQRLRGAEIDRDLVRLRHDTRAWLREHGADTETAAAIRDEIAALRARIGTLLGR